MRILVVGAGALGGYFGGRLAAAGRDVTFLVRSARARTLAETGLVIHSPRGDLTLRDMKTITESTLRGQAPETFDLILLGCKAYDLDGAIASLAPAVGPETLILPFLNGMRHLDTLRQRFGAHAVLGGVCSIAATLDARREIVHLNDMHSLVFGELDGSATGRLHAVSAALGCGHSGANDEKTGNAGFDAKASGKIVQEMWEKWVFLATLAGSTCLFRAPIGDIVATPDGALAIERLLAECRAIAARNGFAVRETFIARTRTMLFAPGSMLTASMLRDVQNGSRTEADHILGDLIRQGDAAQQATGEITMLRLAYSQLKAYEAGISRNQNAE